MSVSLYCLSKSQKSSDRNLKKRRSLCLVSILTLSLVACTPTPPSPSSVAETPQSTNTLTIWWDKGFTLEEDEALRALVAQWEKQNGSSIALSFYTTDELPQKAQRAIQAGKPPDILMSNNAERVLNPRLAWQGKLVDVSDVIEPVKSLYPKTVLQGVFLYNNVEKKRSYYAVPLHQAATHLFYWRDIIALAGYSEKDIPQDWDAFWQFWQRVPDKLPNQKIYGIGLPMSAKAGDTYQAFEQVLEAYNVQILDDRGQLQVDQPHVRQGIIDCLKWYTQFYTQGYVPPEAVKWLNPDNNRSLLNRTILITSNSSLSIPAAVRQDKDLYLNKLGTIEFPNKPNGKPMRHIISVRQAVIIADSPNQAIAKEFLTYLIKPEVAGNYLKASGGRNLPILRSVWQDPFWRDPRDPHISMVAKTLNQGQTRLYAYVENPSYSGVLEENLWGKAIARIVVEKIPPEQAADEAIARIQQIFQKWR